MGNGFVALGGNVVRVLKGAVVTCVGVEVAVSDAVKTALSIETGDGTAAVDDSVGVETDGSSRVQDTANALANTVIMATNTR